jgi:hypothetical protein
MRARIEVSAIVNNLFSQPECLEYLKLECGKVANLKMEEEEDILEGSIPAHHKPNDYSYP